MPVFKRMILSIICVSCWGANFPLLKLGVKDLPPFYFTGLRLFFMALLGIFFVPVPTKDWGKILILSFILFALPLGLTTLAVIGIDSSLVALFIELEVPMALILGAIFLKERLNMLQMIGVVISFVGIYFVVQSPEINISNIWCLFYILIAALSYAIAAVFIKFINLPSGTMSSWSCLLASPMCLVISFFTETKEFYLPQTNMGYISFFLSGLFSFIGFGLWNKLLKENKVSKIVPMAMLVPISSLITAYFLLDETTHLLALIGGAITLVGVFFQTFFCSDN